MLPPGPVQLLPNYGYTVLQLSTVASLGIGLTSAVSGQFTFVMSIPNDPGMSGLQLLWQGLVVENQGAVLSLTNAFGDHVQ